MHRDDFRDSGEQERGHFRQWHSLGLNTLTIEKITQKVTQKINEKVSFDIFVPFKECVSLFPRVVTSLEGSFIFMIGLGMRSKSNMLDMSWVVNIAEICWDSTSLARHVRPLEQKLCALRRQCSCSNYCDTFVWLWPPRRCGITLVIITSRLSSSYG